MIDARLAREEHHRADALRAPVQRDDDEAARLRAHHHVVARTLCARVARASTDARCERRGRACSRCTANVAPRGPRQPVRGRDREPLVGDEADRGAVGAQHVHRRLDEALQHLRRIELERDLLAQRPHALEHAMRLGQLLRAQRHALLEHPRQLALGQRDVLEHHRGALLREERVSGTHREQHAEGEQRHAEQRTRLAAEGDDGAAPRRDENRGDDREGAHLRRLALVHRHLARLAERLLLARRDRPQEAHLR